MPSDTTQNQNDITGRCYCGTVSLRFSAPPQIVAYCHCSDCRRWTGAPAPAFAAFAPDTLTLSPDLGPGTSHTPGVTRWNCPDCGSPIAAQFDYLPDQTYVPIGLLDQAADFPPAMHCHSGSTLPWLHMNDTLPRANDSGRDALTASHDI
ncbi:GFA family protein [Shimia abyssi]|uniref:CENP-V/GFA domain-containing protein n=1 Tax=Shimia abyssi TaxID=1662395 RepID=A0A2P8FKE7_9RHOB|nr:GFA family protein [Shimia abyssi]PSL22207.1 hypothetical protein CLV88_101632 [Shimia abyssi]